MKVLVCDPVSPKGVALLEQRPEFKVVVLPKRLPESELIPLVSDAVALLVRSETKVTRAVIEAAPWTVMMSAEGVPATPIAGCLAALAAPAGRGKAVAVTGTAAAIETGCVAGKLVTATLDAALPAPPRM